MDISCYTVRPGPDSGWLTFFELPRAGRASGFFLVLGPAECPATGPDPDQRRVAQETARGIVGAAKALRAPRIEEWIEDVGRRVAAAPVPLEYGAMAAGEESLSFRVEGRVRVVPVAAGSRRRWERDLPKPGDLSIRRVEPGDRFFFGRVPREAAAGLPPADLLEGIERGGSGDGALILTVHSVRGAVAMEESVVPVSIARTAAAEPPPSPVAESAPPKVQTPPAAVEPPPPVGVPGLPLAAEPAVPPGPGPPGAAPASPSISRALHPGTRPLRHRMGVAPAAWVALILAGAALATYLAWLRPEGHAPDGAAGPAAKTTAGSPGGLPAAGDSRAPAGGSAPGAGVTAPPATPPAPGVAWEAHLPDAVTGSPLPAGGRIIVGCRDGMVYGLSPDSGRVAWRFAGQKGFGGGAVVRDSVACIGGFDGVVRAFIPSTGRTLWEYPTAGRINASPVFTDDGRVVAVSYDHTVYALDAATGRLAWKRRLEGILWATPALGSKLLYVPGLDGVLAALNPRWGSVAWRFRAGGEIYSAPAATDSLVVFGCENGSVYAVVARTGAPAWRLAVGHPVGGGVRAVAGFFLVGDDGGVLHAIEAATGRERWSYRTGAAIKSTPFVDGRTVVVSSHDGGLYAMDLDGGQLIGRIPLDVPMASSPVIVGDRLYVGTHDGRVVALRLR